MWRSMEVPGAGQQDDCCGEAWKCLVQDSRMTVVEKQGTAWCRTAEHRQQGGGGGGIVGGLPPAVGGQRLTEVKAREVKGREGRGGK